MADEKGKKVGTPAQREAVVGTAARMLDMASKSVQSLLNGLNEAVIELGLKIDQKTAQLNGLNDQYAEKERQATITMQQNMQEKGLKAANDLLVGYGMSSIKTDELTGLKTDLATIKQNYKQDLTTAVTAAANDAKTVWAAEKALLMAQNERAAAEDKFALKGANDKIELLQKQVDMLTKQLDEERKASIERAKAGAIGNINLGQAQR